MKKIIVAVISFLISLQAFAKDPHHGNTPTKVNCLDCHTCEAPTPKNICLKLCPTLSLPKASGSHQLSEAPDSFQIDELSDLYMPVTFNHKMHAEMTQMGKWCETCHHYSPKGLIPPCKKCHGGEQNPNNLRQPTLKGAYHRQCLSCHREWDHDTKCVLCHLQKPKGNVPISEVKKDKTDIMGAKHPKINVPDTKIYKTAYKKAPVVTFRHQEHIDLFGLRCVDCHKSENCSYCHELKKSSKSKKTQEEVHAICNDCHKKDKCDKCHDAKEKPSFSHESTGWELNRYHKKLDCRSCHPTRKKITRISKECSVCHAGWTKENFRHSVAGLQLDQMHAQFDCSSCHKDNAYDKPPVCTDCHPDKREHKKAPPGEYLK